MYMCVKIVVLVLRVGQILMQGRLCFPTLLVDSLRDFDVTGDANYFSDTKAAVVGSPREEDGKNGREI